MQITAKEIAQLLGGNLEGNGKAKVSRPGRIEEGGEGTLTFLDNAKYEQYAYSVKSTVLLVHKNFRPTQSIVSEAVIRVDNVRAAVGALLEKFVPQEKSDGEIADNASLHASVVLGNNVAIGTFSVLSENVKVGEGTIIHPQVFLGKNVEIGKGCIIYPGVKVYHGCKIGDYCILHANVVIGGDGFGFSPQPDGSYHKIPQIGNVVIEDQVELGANCTVDRATMGSTIIRQGVKLDNLIMVAHNVEIGENTMIAAQAGIAGSTKIGSHCLIGGQAGFVGHIEVANGTKVQAQSGVAAPVKEPNTALYGSPALSYKNYLKSYAVFKKLPDLYRKINQLEKKIIGNG